jgi:hypothetical protein
MELCIVKFKFKYLFLIGTQALIFVHDSILLMVHMKSDIMSMSSYVGLLVEMGGGGRGCCANRNGRPE